MHSLWLDNRQLKMDLALIYRSEIQVRIQFCEVEIKYLLGYF